jgi:3'-5' exoribonuclease
MKTKYVCDLIAGESVDEVFVLAEKNMAQKKDGGNYLTLELRDKGGRIKGVVWDNVASVAVSAASGDFVRIRGNVSEYRGSMQVVVRRMKRIPATKVDPADFLPITTRNVETMFERLTGLTRVIETDYIRELLEAFWSDPSFVADFKTAPAAKRMHHAYIGGLLEHTLSMSLLAERIAGHYQGIDMDLLMAGVILHDIGKTRELSYDVQLDYSDEGRLLSHIVIGIEMVNQKLKLVDNFPIQKASLLKHMIISHHGSREFGSPEPPKTLEAFLLNHIDEIDSKVNSIRDFIAKEDQSENWTSYHRLLERHFYTGNRESNQ